MQLPMKGKSKFRRGGGGGVGDPNPGKSLFSKELMEVFFHRTEITLPDNNSI